MGAFAVWQTRSAARWLRYLTWWCLAWTLAATLGLGYHYLVDLVVAVPFLTGIRALAARHLADARVERAAALAGGLGLVFGWLVVLRWCTEWLTVHVVTTYLLSAVSTLFAFFLDVRLFSTTARRSAVLPLGAPLRGSDSPPA